MRIADLVGRCLAEQRSARVSQSFTLDLTYRNDPDGDMPVGAMVLLGSHPSSMRKSVEDASRPLPVMREDGSRYFGPAETHLRYLICGEFGHAKGRAHWHGIMFVEGKPLELPDFGRRVEWPFWPHGFAWFGSMDRKSIAYAAKYALKDAKADGPQYAGGRRRAFYSRKPPLGDEFFDDRARRLAQSGLALHDAEYYFRDVRNSKGEPYRYMMTGRTLERFCERYVAYWAQFQSGSLPVTEFLERKYFDPVARRERLLDAGELAQKIAAKQRERELLRERREAREASRPDRWYERRDVGTLLLDGRASVLVAGSDGTCRFSSAERGVSCNGRSAPEFFRGAASFGLSGSEAETAWRWVRGAAVRFDPEGVRYRPEPEAMVS